MTRFKKFAVSLLTALCLTSLGGCFPLSGAFVPLETAIDETALAAVPTEDGGFVLLGYSVSRCSWKNDIYVAEVDANGEELWAKNIGGTGWVIIQDVAVSADGSFWAVGAISSHGYDEQDAYLTKIDAAGDVQWTKTYGGPTNEEAWSVWPTADGGAVALASKNDLDTGLFAWDLMRIDAEGAIIEEIPLELSNIAWLGEIRGCANGDFVLLTTQYVENKHSTYRTSLIPIDPQGVVLWTQAFPEGIEFMDAIQCRDGGFALAGTFESVWENTRSHLYLSRLDEDGAVLWANVYGGAVEINGSVITECANGDFVLAGEQWGFGTAMAVRVNAADGLAKWTAHYGNDGFDRAFDSVQELSDGTLILSGVKAEERDWSATSTAPQQDAYLVQLDAEGVELMSAVSGKKLCIVKSSSWKEGNAEPVNRAREEQE
jgi:hypothetical protein